MMQKQNTKVQKNKTPQEFIASMEQKPELNCTIATVSILFHYILYNYNSFNAVRIEFIAIHQKCISTVKQK